MKSLALISAYPAQGKTTIAVNLAAGLTRSGNKTILLETGDPALLKTWFNIVEDDLTKPYQLKNAANMGFDLRITPVSNIHSIDYHEYDFLILDTGKDPEEHLETMEHMDLIAACTDLRAEDTASLPCLDKVISKSTHDRRSIDLIIPTIINTKEWSNNSEVLFALLEYFGESRTADMVPE